MITESNKCVIMYTTQPFPEGAASSNRIYALARTFIEIGYSPVVLSTSIGVESHQKNALLTA